MGSASFTVCRLSQLIRVVSESSESLSESSESPRQSRLMCSVNSCPLVCQIAAHRALWRVMCRKQVHNA